MLSNVFNKSLSESNLYKKVNDDGDILIIFFHVDDLIFTINISIETFKTTMKTYFDMIELGLLKYFLGIEVSPCREMEETQYA